jgi:hypothetical protein
MPEESGSPDRPDPDDIDDSWLGQADDEPPSPTDVLAGLIIDRVGPLLELTKDQRDHVLDRIRQFYDDVDYLATNIGADLIPLLRDTARDALLGGPIVSLGSSHREPVRVLTSSLKLKTKAQFDVISALLAAGDAGLTGDQLIVRSKHTDAVNVLGRVKSSAPAWYAVIHLPGPGGERYRIG